MELRKICLIGDFSVGKTSLVRRFVSNIFSEDYITTIGVKVETKQVDLSDKGIIKLVIWDIAGADAISSVAKNYLQGAAGYLLVVDGSRKTTLDAALDLKIQVDSILGTVPSFGLLNKCDLVENWEIPDSFLASQSEPAYWRLTSALTGERVEETFRELAQAVV